MGREAFSKIRQGHASKTEAHDIILEWCFASVQVMMQAMSLSQNKSFARRMKDFVQIRRNAGGDSCTGDIGMVVGDSYTDLEMFKS